MTRVDPPARAPHAAHAEARPLGGRTPGDDAPTIDREGAIAPLRLAIGKDGLGIELAGPAVVACLDVNEAGAEATAGRIVGARVGPVAGTST